MLKYSDLVDIALQRAARLGLVDPETGKADGAELELYIFQALLDVSEVHDIDAFTVANPQIAVTDQGQYAYGVPPDFGRLIAPRVQNKRGIYLFDTVRNLDLEYVDPNTFARLHRRQEGTPQFFTVARRQLFVSPTPDTNNGKDYAISGVYIERVSRPDPDNEVLLAYPSVLVDIALFRLAGDMGKMTDALIAERSDGLARLIGGPLGTVKRIAESAVGAVSKSAQT